MTCRQTLYEEAEARAKATNDPTAKQSYLATAANWRRLAAFVHPDYKRSRYDVGGVIVRANNVEVHSMTRKFIVWNSVQCQYGSGSWAVIDGTLVVITALGRKTAKLDGFPPEALAAVLMEELAQEHQSGIA